MSLTATLPQAVSSVNPAVTPVAYSTSALRGVTLHNPYRALGLRWQEVADYEAAEGRITSAELAYLAAHAAEINAELELLARDPQTAIQLIQPCTMTSSDFRRLGAAAFAAWQHSRFARSERRARKTAATCRRCLKLGHTCWQHGGAQ